MFKIDRLPEYVRHYLRKVIGTKLEVVDAPKPAFVYKPDTYFKLPLSLKTLEAFLGEEFVKNAPVELIFSILIGLAYHEAAHAFSGEKDVKPHSLNNIICDSNDFNFVPKRWPGSIPFTLSLTNFIYRRAEDVKSVPLATSQDKLQALLHLAVTFMRKLKVPYDGKDVRSLPLDHPLAPYFEKLKEIMREARKAEIEKRPDLVKRFYKIVEEFWVEEEKGKSKRRQAGKLSGKESQDLGQALDSVSVPVPRHLTKTDARDMAKQADKTQVTAKMTEKLEKIEREIEQKAEEEAQQRAANYLDESCEMEEVTKLAPAPADVNDRIVLALRPKLRQLLFQRRFARRKPSIVGSRFSPEKFYEVKTNPEAPRIRAEIKRVGRVLDESEVVLCFDRSGSMGGENEAVCVEVAATIYMALSTLSRVKAEIIGFNERPWLIKGRKPLSLDTVLRRIPIGLKAQGGTNLPLALKESLKMVRQSAAHRRIAVCLTDGDLSGEIDVKALVLWAGRDKIDVLCVAVSGSDPEELRETFGPRNVLLVERIAELAEEMSKIVLLRV